MTAQTMATGSPRRARHPAAATAHNSSAAPAATPMDPSGSGGTYISGKNPQKSARPLGNW